jgi:N-acetyl-anhydromuramyl-L-alanine amidase AmpD
MALPERDGAASATTTSSLRSGPVTGRVGRTYWVGAHVKGHNEGSLGICLIGRDEFTGDQLLALRNLHHRLVVQYPTAQWFNHYELDESKTCPNFDAVGYLFEDY